MPVRIVIVAEAEADRRQICDLIDRKIRAHSPDWWGEDQIEEEREYCGLKDGSSFTTWHELSARGSSEGALRRGGYIGFRARRPLHSDYPEARNALINCILAPSKVDVVVLVRDMDDQPKERANSLAQARDDVPPDALRVVLALPETEREAWVLNGFEPRDATEKAALARVRKELGFDPRLRPEELQAMKHGAKRDPKRVLKELMGRDHERQASCWRETPWHVLRERGQGSGLTQFLAEVKEKLVPLVTGQPI